MADCSVPEAESRGEETDCTEREADCSLLPEAESRTDCTETEADWSSLPDADSAVVVGAPDCTAGAEADYSVQEDDCSVEEDDHTIGEDDGRVGRPRAADVTDTPLVMVVTLTGDKMRNVIITLVINNFKVLYYNKLPLCISCMISCGLLSSSRYKAVQLLLHEFFVLLMMVSSLPGFKKSLLHLCLYSFFSPSL